LAEPPASVDNSGYLGAKDHFTSGSPYNQISFVARQILATVAGAMLVQVKGVTNAGGIAASGFVNVQIMVNQVDGVGNTVPHGIMYHLPYCRLQGGTNAIIIDPVIGDIGVAVFADRDISSVKATKRVANPGSRRKHSYSDGVYIGACLNGVPTQVVAFTDTGISITTPQALTILAANVILDSTGNFAVTGAVVAGVGGTNQVSLQTHKHGVGTPAAGTFIPTPGT
jgi:hypothetical protein